MSAGAWMMVLATGLALGGLLFVIWSLIRSNTRRWVETISRAVGATVPALVSWEWPIQGRRSSGH